jgi:adenylyl-sulfate kinase
MSLTSGHVFWLFGLSGAGKTTLAGGLAASLRAGGAPVLTLDGDALRAGLCQGLGFSDNDRAENLRRAAETAKLGVDSGLCVVASFITPQEAHRALVSGIVGRGRLTWVHLDAPLEICRQRDVKGLYARAAAGQVPHMTGVSSDFEAPSGADLIISTARENIATSSARLLEFARALLRQPPA